MIEKLLDTYRHQGWWLWLKSLFLGERWLKKARDEAIVSEMQRWLGDGSVGRRELGAISKKILDGTTSAEVSVDVRAQRNSGELADIRITGYANGRVISATTITTSAAYRLETQSS